MANDTNANPMLLDTAATITTSPVMIKEMRWRGITAGADDLVVSETPGNAVATKKGSDAGAGDSVLIWDQPKPMVGFVLTTIDSGVLEVWVG